MHISPNINKVVGYLLIVGVVVIGVILAAEVLEIVIEHIRGDVGD